MNIIKCHPIQDGLSTRMNIDCRDKILIRSVKSGRVIVLIAIGFVEYTVFNGYCCNRPLSDAKSVYCLSIDLREVAIGNFQTLWTFSD